MPYPRLKPEIVGGHYLSSMRAQFDQDSKNIIVASNRQLFYYNIETCEQAGRANLNSPNLSQDERIIACDKLDSSLYLITNNGLVFLWDLETRDWINELALPVNENEVIISCKMLSKRQYVYSILNSETNKTTLYFSMSRSERERPKQRDAIGECTLGEQHTFDIGAFVDLIDLDGETKTNRDKQAKQRCLAYINGPHVYFQRIAINEKFSHECYKQRIKDFSFTCVRANAKRPLVAAGDSLGRIYLYSGNFGQDKFNRTKLHWHSLPVNDLCFSSTGNTLFSVGGESGCVVVWDLSENNVGQKRIVPRLGMPIRYLNCSSTLNQLVLSFEDNEIQFMDTNNKTTHLKTLTRRTMDMYRQNDYKALRCNRQPDKSIGLLWNSVTDTIVTNARTGWLQFYSPKEKSKIQSLNFLKSHVLSLETKVKVVPSDITRATMTLDGNWLAFYETRKAENSFPDVKLHIWQRSSATNRWVWIQTADRLHSSTAIVDLKFSPDGQYLISVSDDGTFQVLYRVSFEPNVGTTSKTSKEMYAKGFVGSVPEKLPAMTTFSQDSSVMAMSLKNDTTLIWMIVDPFKLVYECQLCQIDSNLELPTGSADQEESNVQPSHQVLGLHFGYHKPTQSIAPLCEVRSNSIRIWNILNPQEAMEYPSSNENTSHDNENCNGVVEFTAAAFDQCPGDGRSLNHFAVCTKDNHVMIFQLQIESETRTLLPLIVVDCTLPYADPDSPLYYSHMCFLANPILDIDQQCHPDLQLVKLLNRLCLMNNYQELVSITDVLTFERQSACNNCNEIKTFDMNELREYFLKNATIYNDETKGLTDSDKAASSNAITEKQKKIRNRLEVQKLLKDVLIRIPSQNLPNMVTLGPMILDRLI